MSTKWKKKEIIKELENLYNRRFSDYEGLMEAGEYDEAQKAFKDCMSILQQLENLGKHDYVGKGIQVASVIVPAGIGAADLASKNYFRRKTFEFEETGTISSTGGRKLLGESFDSTKTPRV